MNGLTLLSLIVVVIGVIVAYRLGRMHGTRPPPVSESPASHSPPEIPIAPSTSNAASTLADDEPRQAIVDEYARLLRSYESECCSLRHSLAVGAGEETNRLEGARAAAERLSGELERARAESVRYREVIVDIENNAPPPLLDSPDAPDDLRLIVGIGPVLERLLQQLGVSTYRQIARWSERDIDEFDAKLPEFPGRIRRDDWVTQARELHLSKYGERP